MLQYIMQIHDNLNTMYNLVMVRPSQHYFILLVVVCLHSSKVSPLPPPPFPPNDTIDRYPSPHQSEPPHPH